MRATVSDRTLPSLNVGYRERNANVMRFVRPGSLKSTPLPSIRRRRPVGGIDLPSARHGSNDGDTSMPPVLAKSTSITSCSHVRWSRPSSEKPTDTTVAPVAALGGGVRVYRELIPKISSPSIVLPTTDVSRSRTTSDGSRTSPTRLRMTPAPSQFHLDARSASSLASPSGTRLPSP